MHFVHVIFLLGVITTIDCFDLVHNPLKLIVDAHALCSKDLSVSTECQYSCALERSNMFSPQYDGVNTKEFGYSHKKLADDCWKSLGTTEKPTCVQADKFIDCFYNATTLAEEVVLKECTEKFPVKDLKTLPFTVEAFTNTHNYACWATCLWESVHAFMDDGSIDVNCINPHLDAALKVAEVIEKCEEDNKQTNMCVRKANRYTCLLKSLKAAQLEHEKLTPKK